MCVVLDLTCGGCLRVVSPGNKDCAPDTYRAMLWAVCFGLQRSSRVITSGGFVVCTLHSVRSGRKGTPQCEVGIRGFGGKKNVG